MTTVRRSAVALATVLSAAILVPAAPAHAAYPSTNTVYRDEVGVAGSDYHAIVKIRIGADKKKIAKFTTILTCPGKKKKIRVVFKNIKIYPGGTFAQMKRNKTGFTYEARGSWGSKAGVTGQMSFMQNQCAPYGWVNYFAEK